MSMISASIPLAARSQPRGDFVERLTHPVAAPASNPFSTLFQILISIGLLPLVLWPTRWAEFTERERQDLIDLVGWWQQRADATDAPELNKIASRLRPRPMLTVLPWLAVGFNVIVMAMVVAQGNSVNRLWDLTFKHVRESQLQVVSQQRYWTQTSGNSVQVYPVMGQGGQQTVPVSNSLYSIWIVTLCFAYGLHWYAVRSHAVTVHSLVKWTNQVARENQFERIKYDVRRIGLTPPWIALGIALCVAQAWWGIPMVFAGAMQRRYATKSSPAIRSALADQTREAFAVARSGPDRFCTARDCGRRLPAAAKFCPCCGTAV